MALAEGDQSKAKYQYIKLRVEQLANRKADEKPLFKNKIVDEFQFDYMPAAEFSKIKSIPEMKVIEMIRDGFYAGQVKDDAWFVSRDEVGRTQERNKLPQARNKTESEYIPVEEFARYKNLDPEKAISMIREGFYQGRIINNQWYVSVSEISPREVNSQTDSPEKAPELSLYDKAFFVVFFAGMAAIIYFIYKLTTCSFMPPGTERVSQSSRANAENRAYLDCKSRWHLIYREQGLSFLDSDAKAHGQCYQLK